MLGVISQMLLTRPFAPSARFSAKMCKMLHFPLTRKTRKRCMMILVQFVCVKWIEGKPSAHPHGKAACKRFTSTRKTTEKGRCVVEFFGLRSLAGLVRSLLLMMRTTLCAAVQGAVPTAVCRRHFPHGGCGGSAACEAAPVLLLCAGHGADDRQVDRAVKCWRNGDYHPPVCLLTWWKYQSAGEAAIPVCPGTARNPSRCSDCDSSSHA